MRLYNEHLGTGFYVPRFKNHQPLILQSKSGRLALFTNTEGDTVIAQRTEIEPFRWNIPKKKKRLFY